MPKTEKSASGTRKSAGTPKKTASKKRTSKTAKSASKKAAGTKKAASGTKKISKKVGVPAEKIGHGIDLVRRCVRALENKKAAKIEVIRVAETSSVTDFYVIATGTSDPHLRALRVELEKEIDAVVPAGSVRIQSEPNSGWCVVDAFDVVVHVFSAEKRDFYNLEELYSSGTKIEI